MKVQKTFTKNPSTALVDATPVVFYRATEEMQSIVMQVRKNNSDKILRVYMTPAEAKNLMLQLQGVAR